MPGREDPRIESPSHDERDDELLRRERISEHVPIRRAAEEDEPASHPGLTERERERVGQPDEPLRGAPRREHE